MGTLQPGIDGPSVIDRAVDGTAGSAGTGLRSSAEAVSSGTHTPDDYRTRGSLLARISGRDEAGWAEFYALYAPLVVWLCQRKGIRDREFQQLVVQAVMSHFATTTWTYDADQGRFRNLLLTVAGLKIHEVERELRPLSSRRSAIDAVKLQKELGPARDDEVEALERFARVRAALTVLAKLPGSNPLHMQVFQLLLKGHALPEVALRSGLSIGNTNVIKHRMLQLLRQIIRRSDA